MDGYALLLAHFGHEIGLEPFGGEQEAEVNFRGDVVWKQRPDAVALVCFSDHTVLMKFEAPQDGTTNGV